MQTERTWRLVRASIAVVMLWCVAMAVAFAVWGNDQWLRGLRALGAPVALAALGLFVVNHLLRFGRWHSMLRAERCAPPVLRSFNIFMAGLALQPTPAKAGIAVRTVLLLPLGVPAHVSLAAYFSERLLDFIGLVMMASLALGAFDTGGRVFLAAAIGSVATIGVFMAPRVIASLGRHRATPPRIQRSLAWVGRFFEDASEMLRGVRFLVFLLLGMLANLCTGLLLWLTLRTARAAIEPLAAQGVVGASHLSGSISLLPGGLGGFELAMLAQLAALGVPAATALVALAIVRIASFWGGVAVGMPLLWVEMYRGQTPGTAPGTSGR